MSKNVRLTFGTVMLTLLVVSVRTMLVYATLARTNR